MASLSFELLFRLLWGTWLGLFFVRRVETSEKFLKNAFWISSILAAFSILPVLSELSQTSIGLALGLLVAGTALYVFFYTRFLRILGFLLVCISATFTHTLEFWSLHSAFSFLSGSLILGGFFGGQFLGHWYLNVPGMHISEIKRILQFLFLGLGLKTVDVLWGLFERWDAGRGYGIDAMGRPLSFEAGSNESILRLNASSTLFSLEGSSWLGLGSFGFLLFSMRILWGLVAPWILAKLIHRTVQLRATQSATGILYAACVLVLVGEATALYLRSQLEWFQ